MSKIERSKRFETERIHTPRNRLRAVLGCWHARQLRNRLHRLTTEARLPPYHCSERGAPTANVIALRG